MKCYLECLDNGFNAYELKEIIKKLRDNFFKINFIEKGSDYKLHNYEFTCMIELKELNDIFKIMLITNENVIIRRVRPSQYEKYPESNIILLIQNYYDD